MSIRFSIIIPCYNAEPYIYELLKCLDKQMTKEVEVILIDDGSDKPVKAEYKWCKVIRQKNKGQSAARNRGLEMAKGEVIGFVDADDLVSDKYISYILSRIDDEWDYMDLSWKSLEDNKYLFKLVNDGCRLDNPSASTRVFRRSFIGDTRFSTKKDACEDEDFTRHLGLRMAKHVCATDFMYFYRTEVADSNSKRFLKGETKTKRIGYFFKKVTRDMTWLLDEIKKEDEYNEVFLLTTRNEIPELEKYCQILAPKPIRVMEARGEDCNFFTIIDKPHRTQVVIFTRQTFAIGGIETFIYSFCKQMSKYYDITVVYDTIANEQLTRLIEICPCLKNSKDREIYCDTIIVNRIGDKLIPNNIHYKRSIQMAHCIKQESSWHLPQDRDYIINVSQASKDSFAEEAENAVVIHNLTDGAKTHKALLLVSALRVGAQDKLGNDARCIKFAKMLDKAKIDYIWLYFGNKQMLGEPENMIYCGQRTDIRPFIAMADYLVQLSGSEAFSYSLLESLICHTPVIVTPLAQNADMGIVDGLNAHVVPFDVEKYDVKKILRIPRFKYDYDNQAIIAQWRELLGDTKPQRNYRFEAERDVVVEVTMQYKDLERNEMMIPGKKCKMKFLRAIDLQNCGFVRIIE